MPEGPKNLTADVAIDSLFALTESLLVQHPTEVNMPKPFPNREPNIEAKFAAKKKAWAANPAILSTTHRIYLGDARLMPELGSERAVHLVVTSPPYFNLIQYPERADGYQLGNLSDYEAFLRELQRCGNVVTTCCILEDDSV